MLLCSYVCPGAAVAVEGGCVGVARRRAPWLTVLLLLLLLLLLLPHAALASLVWFCYRASPTPIL